jgi:hypothetical protein
VRQVVGGAAEALGDPLDAEFGVRELLAHDALRLEDLADVAVQLAPPTSMMLRSRPSSARTRPLRTVSLEALAAADVWLSVLARVMKTSRFGASKNSMHSMSGLRGLASWAK